eukprot:UN21898
MEIAQGYARRPKRIYAVEKCRFIHFVITVGYPFFTKDMIQILGFPELLFSLDWHLGVSKSKNGA